MSSLEEPVASVQSDPLPELHPDRLSIEVELPTTSSDSEKLPLRQDAEGDPQHRGNHEDALSSEQKNLIDAVVFLLLLMSAISVVTLVGRVRTANQWAGLMEASGFVEWPPIAGNYPKILVATIPLVLLGVSFIVALGVFLVARVRRTVGVKLSLVRVLIKLAMCSVIVFLIANLYGYTTSWGSKLTADELVRVLAKQTTASANFNRGYCHAWCRLSASGTGAFLRGECGPDQATVFTKVGWLKVGHWCEQAIDKQSFDAAAKYTGISPLACLNGGGGGRLTAAFLSDILGVINVIVGVYILLHLICFLI